MSDNENTVHYTPIGTNTYETSVLIVNEISMFSLIFMDTIDLEIKKERRDKNEKKNFYY